VKKWPSESCFFVFLTNEYGKGGEKMSNKNQILDSYKLFEELKDSRDVERIKSTMESLNEIFPKCRGGSAEVVFTLKIFLEGRLRILAS
jgi:hypothetical protein